MSGTASYTMTGLTNDTEYTFQVAAYGQNTAVINNLQSNEATATSDVIIATKSLTVTEATGAGQTAEYMVVLDTDPGGTVTVTGVDDEGCPGSPSPCPC